MKIECMFRNQKGMTLIEVLAAMIILGIAVITFVAISSYSSLAEQRSDMKTGALRLAENKLNEVRNAVLAEKEVTEQFPTIGDLDENGAKNGYQYKVQDLPMGNTLPADFDQSGIPSTAKRVNLQAVVLLDDGTATDTTFPRLLTVTVYWGG